MKTRITIVAAVVTSVTCFIWNVLYCILYEVTRHLFTIKKSLRKYLVVTVNICERWPQSRYTIYHSWVKKVGGQKAAEN